MNETIESNTSSSANKTAALCELDFVFETGIRQPKFGVDAKSHLDILSAFESILSAKNISADPSKNAHYRTGWRSGEGSALAVLFPQTLIQLWGSLKIAVSHNLIIVMQAANTGLTEGSTPSGNDYDRPVVIINTRFLNALHIINEGAQAIGMPGATLYQLQSELIKINRAPHSVIGSSSLGASIVGGIANNSGGALVKRGPAYTELSVYAQIDKHGELMLVNHLGIDLGNSPDAIIQTLSDGSFATQGLGQGQRKASDTLYQARVKDIDADTPSRFNADPRRLYELSGCAGKVAVFAVRVDTYPVAEKQASFYIGTNDPGDLYQLRRLLLSKLDDLPEVGEYMHRDIFDVAQKYGKDTFLSVLYLGTKRLPKMFSIKGAIDAYLNKKTWLPEYLSDRLLQGFSRLFPQHLPKRMLEYRQQYEHHLIMKLSGSSIAKGKTILQNYFDNKQSGGFFECTAKEANRAYLHRFAAAGAAIRYHTMHSKDVGDILALDIALKRNESDWVESFSPDIEQHIEKKLYYGHFFCHVFHQDYILKKGANAHHVKKLMLAQLDQRGAKYPAEHNVGHLYKADDPLRDFYKELDPSNTFNPGIGKMDKNQRNCNCCL